MEIYIFCAFQTDTMDHQVNKRFNVHLRWQNILKTILIWNEFKGARNEPKRRWIMYKYLFAGVKISHITWHNSDTFLPFFYIQSFQSWRENGQQMTWKRITVCKKDQKVSKVNIPH